MNRVFADSFYFFAVLNPKDDAHDSWSSPGSSVVDGFVSGSQPPPG